MRFRHSVTIVPVRSSQLELLGRPDVGCYDTGTSDGSPVSGEQPSAAVVRRLILLFKPVLSSE